MKNFLILIAGILVIFVAIFLVALLVGWTFSLIGLAFNLVGWVLSYWWLWLIIGGLYVIIFKPVWFFKLFK